MTDNEYRQRLQEFISDWETDPDTRIDQYPGFDDFPDDADMLKQHEVEYRTRKRRETLARDHFVDVIGMTDPTFDWTPVQESIWRELGDDSLGEISGSAHANDYDHRALDWRATDYDGDHLDRCAHIIGVLQRYPNVEIVRSGRIDTNPTSPNGNEVPASHRFYGVIFRAVVTPEMARRGETFRLIGVVTGQNKVLNALDISLFERTVSGMENDGWTTKTVLQSPYLSDYGEGMSCVTAVMVRAGKKK